MGAILMCDMSQIAGNEEGRVSGTLRLGANGLYDSTPQGFGARYKS
jgi:hypothetical protein